MLVHSIQIKVKQLNNVKIELFSRVAKDSYSKIFPEQKITRKRTYAETVDNPEDDGDSDIVLYMVITPTR